MRSENSIAKMAHASQVFQKYVIALPLFYVPKTFGSNR
jgi:hypothetical protein